MSAINIDSDHDEENRGEGRNDGVIDLDPDQEIGVPVLGDAPPRRNLQDTIPSTPFSSAYRSTFTTMLLGQKCLLPLTHVNCNYLSTPGLPPTLLQLKQHAQSLVIIIKALTASTAAGVIDNANSELHGIPFFNDGETYDFLNNLSKPYGGPANEALRTHHNMPLTSLLNTLQEDHISSDGCAPPKVQINDICPLHRAEKIPDNGQALPYATHQTLISHANEVLELLDNEYSAKGGVLGILPQGGDKESRKKAESTLLGQMIAYLQKLMKRMHELEREYANSMDVIAGEAVVPHETLSKLGVEGRQGREVVYPQDRFVLANAGDDLWQFLNAEFEKKEREDNLAMVNAREMGVTGEALLGQDDTTKGLTALDITTRYYRLRGEPLKTVFIIPAHKEHPGTKVTRDMEKVPTVVSVVKPTWPERANQWEMKNRSNLEELKRIREEVVQLRTKGEWEDDEKKVLLFQQERLAAENRDLKKKLEDQEAVIMEPGNDTTRKLVQRTNENTKLNKDLERLIKDAKKDREAAEKEKIARLEARQEMDRLRIELADGYRKRKEKLEAEYAAKVQKLTNKKEQAGKVNDKLKEVWKARIIEAAVAAEHIQEKHPVNNDPPSEECIRKGTEKAHGYYSQILAEAGVPEGGPHMMSGGL